MKNLRVYPSSKESILDAVEQIAMTEGILRITIDNVAAKSKISKGGVMYHFPHKELLIAELVKRFAQELTDAFQTTYQNMPSAPGRAARALLSVFFDSDLARSNWLQRTGTLFISTFVHFPAQLNFAFESRKHVQDLLIQDGLPDDVSHLLMVALDGLCMADAFGFHECEQKMRSALRNRLEKMIEEALHEE